MPVSDNSESEDGASPQALAPTPVVVAWSLAVGIDLLFNAGLFAGRFDQTREPTLLPDAILFRRIPIAYLALAAAVVGLAWLLDRTGQVGALAGAKIGTLAGMVVVATGLVSLWTAIDLTGLFVGMGSLVQVGELAAAGSVLGAFRAGGDRGRLSRHVLLLAFLAAVAGIVTQNLWWNK